MSLARPALLRPQVAEPADALPDGFADTEVLLDAAQASMEAVRLGDAAAVARVASQCGGFTSSLRWQAPAFTPIALRR